MMIYSSIAGCKILVSIFEGTCSKPVKAGYFFCTPLNFFFSLKMAYGRQWLGDRGLGRLSLA